MIADIPRAIFIACIRLFIHTPWILIGAIAFYKKLQVSKYILYISIAFIVVFDFFSNVYLRIFQYDEHYLLLDSIRYWIYYLLIFLLFVICFRLFWAEFIYVFCLLNATSELVNQSAYLIAKLYYPPDTTISIASAPLYSLLMVCFSIICFFPLLYFCRQTLNVAFEELEKQNKWKLCVVPVLFFFIFRISIFIINKYSSDTMLTLLILLIFASGILSYVVNVQMLLANIQSTRNKLEKETSERLLELQKNNYKYIQKNIQETKAARHDLRFHLSVLSSVAQKQDVSTLLEYLNHYIESIPDVELSLCDNIVADAIARHYLTQVQIIGASCDCKIVLPEKAGISDSELCVVIGNLLENAVKSLKQQGEKGWLHFRCQKQAQRILITADNSILQPTVEFHMGIGLESVSTIAEKYNGNAKFEMSDSEFKASVILHIE